MRMCNSSPVPGAASNTLIASKMMNRTAAAAADADVDEDAADAPVGGSDTDAGDGTVVPAL